MRPARPVGTVGHSHMDADVAARHRSLQAWVRGSNTGPLDWDPVTVDEYAQHAFPPKESGRTTRPRCGLGRPAQTAGTLITLRASESRVRPIHDTCAFGLCFLRVEFTRFVGGAWLAPFMRRGGASLATDRRP